MVKSITFLVIGNILLTLGLFGYFINNPYLPYLCLPVAFVFFIRQLVEAYRRPTDTPIKS